MTTPPPFTGQDIGMAQNATRDLLDTLLAGAGTEFAEWVVLRLLSQGGVPTGRAAFRDHLAQLLTLATADADLVLVRAAARGLIEADGDVRLTDAGAAAYQRLSDEVGKLTAELYAGFDPDDLAVTARVLRAVTQKATTLR